jgi:hypothetical protein
MSSTNRSNRVTNPDDFFRTPAACVDLILPFLPTAGSVLEPCAGDGAIVAALRARGVDCVDAIEIDEDRAAKVRAIGGDVLCSDALGPEAAGIWQAAHGLILTNPPFSLAMEFVELALASQRPHRGTSAFLLRLSWLASSKRAAFHRENPSDVYVLSRRPSFTGDGKSDSTDYAFFVWGPGPRGRWAIL